MRALITTLLLGVLPAPTWAAPDPAAEAERHFQAGNRAARRYLRDGGGGSLFLRAFIVLGMCSAPRWHMTHVAFG